MSLEILRLPVLDDNYVWLLHCPQTPATAVVDPGVAAPVLAACVARGWRLDQILLTHHHGDHIGGVAELVAATGCSVTGCAADAARLPPLSRGVGEGDRVRVGVAEATVRAVPGHTLGHIAYWFAAQDALFCGDTLFALGCGRMFEGTPEQFWASLSALRALPDSTRVYCAHEYTASNWRFAAAISPPDHALTAAGQAIATARQAGDPTVPSLLGDEKRLNPFLRADDPALAAHLGLAGQPAVTVFAHLRAAKNTFRG